MLEIFKSFFTTNGYIPHGHCYLWQTSLVWVHALSDILIGIAYFSIPLMLIYFVQKKEDVPFKGIYIMFSVFILSCGTGHFIEVLILWQPYYWISGFVKAITALISIYTALELYPLIPQALALPSPSQLDNLNKTLEKQICDRKTAEKEIRKLNYELEDRVKQRTKELEESKYFSEKIAKFTPNVIYIYDLEKKTSIYSNGFIREMLGYEPENFFECDRITKKIHHHDVPKMIRHWDNCYVLGKDKYLEIDYRIKDVYGNWKWIHSRDTVFEYNREGKVKLILGIASDISQRKNIEISLQNLNNQLSTKVKQLESRNQQMSLLKEMNDFLLTCLNMNEAKSVLADLLEPIFPNSCGSIFIINNVTLSLEEMINWGDKKNSKTLFKQDECWCLRRGSLYKVLNQTPSLFCSHINFSSLPEASLCVPLTAQGETLGVLNINFSTKSYLTEEQTTLAENVSQQIALAFANIKSQENLKSESLVDSLTKLNNRRYLDNFLIKEIPISSRNNYDFTVVMIDVDHFKSFNDIYGHQAGDYVLKKIALYLKQNIRDEDIACRYGGEELTLILVKTGLENARKKAESLRKGIESLSLCFNGDNLPQITVSMGIASFPDNGTTAESLLKMADEALYQAKENGRNQVVCA